MELWCAALCCDIYMCMVYTHEEHLYTQCEGSFPATDTITTSFTPAYAVNQGSHMSGLWLGFVVG